jgi:predicted nucleotidyltransferase
MIMPKMGAKRSKLSRSASHSLADALLSKTQQRVLALLFGQPSRSFYANEVIALAGSGSGAVQRELGRLVASGLVSVRAVGNQRHYQANEQSPLFAELRSIVLKTVGLAGPLRAALAPISDRILAAFVYGSVAKQVDTASSDIDVMIVSDTVTYADVFEHLEEAAAKLGRPVNPTILSRKELSKRLKQDNAFITRILSQPTIWLIGSAGDLTV